jgi:monoamine oxidase
LTETDVVIVGAGLAGLTAGRRLTGAGVETILLEARDRVGGRVHGLDLGGGAAVELGGQWAGAGHTRLLALAEEFGLATFPTPMEGESIVEWEGENHRYEGLVPRKFPITLADFGQSAVRLERLAEQVDLDAPWHTPRAGALDSETFASWVRRNVALPATARIWRTVTGLVWTCEPKEISLLHILFYIKTSGGLEYLLETEGGAQDARFVGGSQQIPMRMAESLGDRVRTSTPVRGIAQNDEGVWVLADRADLTARRVIVALPPALRHRLAYSPALPTAHDQMCQRMPGGSVTKCIALYDEPFWRADGLSGFAWSVTGPVTAVFDNSPPDGDPWMLMAFVEGTHSRRLDRLDPTVRRDEVVEALARLFGPRARDTIGYHDMSWAAEEWTRGCYAGNFVPGGWTEFGPALREPVGRIHWASTELATAYAGYMEGAIRSGERAADEVLEFL